MLAIAVLWAALPASLCLFASQPPGMPSCCRAMMHDCNAGQMSMSGACCQVQRQNAAVAPNSPAATDHFERLAFVPVQFTPHSFTAMGAVSLSARAAPPLDSSPGRSSILRI